MVARSGHGPLPTYNTPWDVNRQLDGFGPLDRLAAEPQSEAPQLFDLPDLIPAWRTLIAVLRSWSCPVETASHPQRREKPP